MCVVCSDWTVELIEFVEEFLCSHLRLFIALHPSKVQCPSEVCRYWPVSSLSIYLQLLCGNVNAFLLLVM